MYGKLAIAEICLGGHQTSQDQRDKYTIYEQ